MIRIGISQHEANRTDYAEERDALDIRWHEFLFACGIAAVPLPNHPELAPVVAAEFECRGLILTGGDSLECYGGSSVRRDASETATLAWARSAQLPVLGVCRGMQFILVESGAGLQPVAGHAGVRHDIETASGIRSVNSYHNLASFDVPAEFEVTARAGSAIEAVAHKQEAIFGVMWHPERSAPLDPIDIAFMRAVFCSQT
jgi:gamma-glutamyl-gamma-aminobutyrate hydrolase PuuD